MFNVKFQDMPVLEQFQPDCIIESGMPGDTLFLPAHGICPFEHFLGDFDGFYFSEGANHLTNPGIGPIIQKEYGITN
jgi:hypothetical protein